MCNVICPKISFCQGSPYRIGASGLICNANGLDILYMQLFLAERYYRGNFGISVFVYFTEKICKVDSLPDECNTVQSP